MQRFDVAVVGSGPAGAACATRLANRGARVALLDERPFPRNKLCGEYLNLGTVRELRSLGVAERLERQATALHGMHLHAHDAVASFPIAPAAWSLARTVLDAELRAAALAAGASPVTGRVRGIDRGEDSVTLHLRGRDGAGQPLEARYVVGADGMHSAVARLCNLTRPSRNDAFGIGGHHPNMPLGTWIEIYSSPRGYLALNPLDGGANALFVMHRPHLARAGAGLREELVRFSSELTGGARVIDDIRFDAQRGAIGPLAHRTVRPACERVLLAGDAAAFVDPFTGQGIYLALVGARLAARAIETALDRPDCRRQAWHDYERALVSAVRERKLIALMMRTMVGWRIATRRATQALQRRPGDFAFLIDAVCAKTTASPWALAAAVGQALR
jgi:flavin-dependent dehydrogenase